MDPSRSGHVRSWPQKIGGIPELGSSSLASERLPFGDAEVPLGFPPQLDDPRRLADFFPRKSVGTNAASSNSPPPSAGGGRSRKLRLAQLGSREPKVCAFFRGSKLPSWWKTIRVYRKGIGEAKKTYVFNSHPRALPLS